VADIIAWLNANSGFVIALLTAVYVGATLLIASGARRSNALAAAGLEQALRLERQRNRPYVVFDFEASDRQVYAVLRNVGIAPAFGVSLTLTPPLAQQLGGQPLPLPLLPGPVRVLPQGRDLAVYVDSSDRFFVQHMDTSFTAEVSYADSDGHVFTDHFTIPVGGSSAFVLVPDRGIAAELARIRKELEGMKRP
jgi:hypothetical protein